VTIDEARLGHLVTTCGLDNVGAPSEGIGLHGTYTFLPARDVVSERSVAEVVVRRRASMHSASSRRTARVLGRAHDRTEGRLPFLQPGERRTTRIAIAAEEMG
jgi:hypothetical protein